MKIIFVTARYYPYIAGGAQISNKILVEGIKNLGEQIEVFTLGEEEKLEVINDIKINRIYINILTERYLKKIVNNKINEKIRTFFINNFHICNVFLYRKIYKLLLQYPQDTILHTSEMSLFYQILWWKAAKKNKLKVIHTLRDPFFIRTFTINGKENAVTIFLTFLKRKIFKYYTQKYIDCIHSPSKYMLDIHQKEGFKFKNTKVIPNTVIIKNILPMKKEIDILYVGRLISDKGIGTLVKAITNLSLASNSVFIGDGILKEKVIKEKIKVTGWLNNIEVFEYMKKAKIVILPSEWEEAFGRVLIEAIANGTLVIGSDKGAIPEVLNYDRKYIFKAKDIYELQKKIKRILLLSEEEYRDEVINLQKYAEKYSYSNHIKEFKKFYKEIAESN